MLIADPAPGLSGQVYHLAVRFVSVLTGLLDIATPRVDARNECGNMSGDADSLLPVALL